MISKLFDSLFGPDYCQYEYTKSKHCVLVPGQFPSFSYDHDEWEKAYPVQKGADGSVKSPVVNPDIPGLSSNDDSSKEPSPVVNPVVPGSSSNDDSSKEQSPVVNPVVPGSSSNDDSSKEPSPVVNPVVPGSSSNDDSSKEASPVIPLEITAACSNVSFTSFTNSEDLSRRQIIALKLPKVAFIADEDVVLTQVKTGVSDPAVSKKRPSEATVNYALKLFTSCSLPVTDSNIVSVEDINSDDKQTVEATVRIGRLGTFTRKSVQMFQSMCKLSQEADRIRKEQKWLAKMKGRDVTTLKNFLLDARPKDEVLRQDRFIMDVSDFSTLACERYLNGFTIDAVCLKLLDEHQPSKIVYLPTYSQMWARQGEGYFRNKVAKFFLNCPAKEVSCILAPVHFESEQHWGLLCFDATSTTIYFDDGLKIAPPTDILTVVRTMLNSFMVVLENRDQYHSDGWNLSLPLPRIGMPTQPTSGEGAASCGVGVILTVRDVIKCGKSKPNFNWCFKDMAHLRRELMLQVLKWRS